MHLANQESQRLNLEFISPEIILLGLIKEGSGMAAHVLRSFGIDLRRVRFLVEKDLSLDFNKQPDSVVMGKLPHTPEAKQLIQFACDESKSLGHNYVGTEHLLLGYLRQKETNSESAHVFIHLGLHIEAVRAAIMELLGEKTVPVDLIAASAAVPKRSVFMMAHRLPPDSPIMAISWSERSKTWFRATRPCAASM